MRRCTSFAGEDRSQAEALATMLRDSGVIVFYDEFEKEGLWGKDLFQHLASIYGSLAKYCVVLVSQHYLRKHWTKHELRQAQARSFQIDREYILPVRLDDTNLPGLAATIGYLDLRHTSVERIALMLQRKLGMNIDELEREADRLTWNGELVDYNGVQVASIWPKQIERAQHRPAYLVTSMFSRIPYGAVPLLWWASHLLRLWPRANVSERCRILGGRGRHTRRAFTLIRI